MPKKLHRCVDKLKRQGGADNPWAVCQASLAHKGAKKGGKKGGGRRGGMRGY